MTQTAISPSQIGVSQSRGHAASAPHREKLEDKLRGQGRSFLERLRALAAASPSGGRQDRQTQNSSASA